MLIYLLLCAGPLDSLRQTVDGDIFYNPSSPDSILIIGMDALDGTYFAPMSFDLEVDTTATVLLSDSLTGDNYVLEFPPAVQRFRLDDTSITSLPVEYRRYLGGETVRRYLTIQLLESPPKTSVLLRHMSLITDSPTPAPTSLPTPTPSSVRPC